MVVETNYHYPELESNSSIEGILSETDNDNDNNIDIDIDIDFENNNDNDNINNNNDNDIINDDNESNNEEAEEYKDYEEEEEEEENCLDMTYIHEDDQPTNYDGIDENHNENDNDLNHNALDDYATAKTLKRNLTETFEKHAKAEKKKMKKEMKEMKKMKKMKKVTIGSTKTSTGTSSSSLSGSISLSSCITNSSIGASVGASSTASSSYVGGVKEKIKAFEQHNVIIKPKNNNNNKVRFDNHNRPPTAPVPTTNKNVPSDTGSSDSKSLLSVYLRIRPPSASQDALSKNESAYHNTVEVVPPTMKDSETTTATTSTASTKISTSIRTYPPLQSNTSKAVRGHQQLHTSSNNTDLIFNGSNKNLTDAAVKGVKEFNFNQVFDMDSTQEDVYNNVAIPLVDGLFPKDNTILVGDKIVGKSALLFSYGITNAGKTHTIMGKGRNYDKLMNGNTKGDEKNDIAAADVNLEESHGIIPRVIDHMLSKIKEVESVELKYQLNLSYLEIYNEHIYDLLPEEKKEMTKTTAKRLPGGPGGAYPSEQNSLRIREGRNGKIYVRGLTKHKVSSFADGIELVSKAKSRRKTSSNSINSDSSRSHSICQFELVALPTSMNDVNDADIMSIGTASSAGYNTDEDSSTSSKRTKKRAVTFWIVDLAGSERSKRTGTFSRSARQKEAALINSSLMKLMRCLQTLRHNQSTNHAANVVPFRESKLTHLFMDHLTGAAASRTSMVVNINPSVADFDETQHVLSYGTVAKSIRISASDYHRKRQAIQMVGNGDAHTKSKDGKKRNTKKESPPRKIARIVKKLSPRAALARMREQQRNNNIKRKEEAGNTKAAKAKDLQVKRKGVGLVRVGRTKQLEDELEEMKQTLAKSKEETERYQSEAVELRGKLVQCESEIRKEIYEETEQYHKCIHQQHNEIVNRLKQQIAAASQTPSKSAMKVHRDRADIMIDELMDKVDECEEEMARMTESHHEQIALLNSEHAAEIAERDEEMAELQASLEEAVENHKKETFMLTDEVSKKTKLIEELQGDNGEESDVSFEESTSFSTVEEEQEEEQQQGTHEKENKIMGHRVNPSPRLRRLPRKRCSEVACANISPPTDKISSTTKKQRKGLSQIRSPFKNKNTRPSNNDVLKKKTGTVPGNDATLSPLGVR